MTNPKSIADKYITPSGRTRRYGVAEFRDDLIVASEFLIWAEDEYFGGHTGKDAYRAMMRMLDMDPRPLRKIVRG